MKVAAQADVLSRGFEHIINPKTDSRSKSLETEHRNSLGARPKERNVSSGKRERSLQDIDKDIETIWKELQNLDKPSKTSEKR